MGSVTDPPELCEVPGRLSVIPVLHPRTSLLTSSDRYSRQYCVDGASECEHRTGNIQLRQP